MSLGIAFDSDEMVFAAAWHGGQDSVLYAISSTGVLRPGMVRPSFVINEVEHLHHLCDALESELDEITASEEASETDEGAAASMLEKVEAFRHKYPL